MTSALVWVLGRGGLLGRRLTAAITEQVSEAACWPCSVPDFAWEKPSVLAAQLEQAVAEFAREVRKNGQAWTVIWVAGSGVIGTNETALQAETDVWQRLLQLLDQHFCQGDDCPPGWIFLSSSAGGVYGNCADHPVTETSTCRPASAYGRNKLRQEALLRCWADTRPSVHYLIGRISNLYGPGQNLSKRQGLISHISRCLIWQHPVHIYVPLDTIRDYLYVDDCALQIAHCLTTWLDERDGDSLSPRGMTKILAAEQTSSIAQIVGIFSRLTPKRHPRVICAPSALSSQQAQRLEFVSLVAPDVAALPRTPLEIGINQTHQGQLVLYSQGRLPAPKAA